MTGVYKITNLINGKFYIGSTKDFATRFRHHKLDLKKQKHHCQPLQRAWNKYGERAFKFEILCITLNEQTIAIEQLYIDWFKPQYNICKIAASCLGVKHCKEYGEAISTRMKGNTIWQGREHTEKAKTKISVANKGRKPYTFGKKRDLKIVAKISKANKGRKHTEEAKLKMSASHKGRKTWNTGTKGIMKSWNTGLKISDSSKDKMRQAKLKFTWGIEKLDSSEVFYTTNLTQFCKDNNLCVTNIHQKRVTGDWRRHKGYKIVSKTSINENKAA